MCVAESVLIYGLWVSTAIDVGSDLYTFGTVVKPSNQFSRDEKIDASGQLVKDGAEYAIGKFGLAKKGEKLLFGVLTTGQDFVTNVVPEIYAKIKNSVGESSKKQDTQNGVFIPSSPTPINQSLFTQASNGNVSQKTNSSAFNAQLKNIQHQLNNIQKKINILKQQQQSRRN
jgi:hypothetical protein